MAASDAFFDFFLVVTGADFVRERLVAFPPASASIVSLFDAFTGSDGGIDDDARFFVARAALGAPDTKNDPVTTFFPRRVFTPGPIPLPWLLIGGRRWVDQ
jgi:hypothetical protein